MRPTAALLQVLRCPLCASAFVPSTGDELLALVCEKEHVFARHDEGHFTLSGDDLPPKRRSLRAENREMVHARRRFLQAGHFQPLVDAIVTAVVAGVDAVILDAGCGEGHYAAAVQRAAAPTLCLGIDNGPEAVRLASKAHRGCSFIVADSRQLPLKDNVVDVIVNVDAPRGGEFTRVLRPGGLLVVAVPLPQHVHELRALPSLGIEHVAEERVRERFAFDFSEEGSSDVVVHCHLGGGALIDLLAMTPHRHHLEDDDVLPKEMTVTLAMTVMRFRRR